MLMGEGFVGANKNVSTLVMVHNSVNRLKTTELHALKWVNCMVCEFYFNKGGFKSLMFFKIPGQQQYLAYDLSLQRAILKN